MTKILVAVDGSENANRAVDHAVQRARQSREPVELHVLNAQPPIPFAEARRVVGQDVINAYHHDEGMKALQAARARLEKSEVAHTFHIAVGPAAETIADYAREHGCDQIVMGSRGMGAIAGVLLGSVAAKVLHLVDIPVTVVK